MAIESINSSYPIEFPHAEDVEKIAQLIHANQESGLTEQEVQKRIKEYGLNSYKAQKQKSIFLVLVDQFKSPIVLLLVVAATLSFLFEHWLEGFSIVGVLFITAALGFFMELQARRSMNALKEMDVSVSKVFRDNTVIEIPSERIVPGDILLVEAGDIVPADGRLFELNQFEADESALTGESLPVTKKLETLEKNSGIADQVNMIFKGTAIVKGNAKAIITGTGLHTELGKITSLVETAEQTSTPLEKKLQGLTKKLMWITSGFALIFIVTGAIQGKDIYLIVETALALAVAAIPEGLPIVATIALTYGMLRMAKKNVLIKRLAAVETLGGINTIFTDKTGTLTENKIEVSNLTIFDETISVEQNKISTDDNKAIIDKLLLISTLCNNAVADDSGNDKKQLGDPIEIALLQFVAANKIDLAEINEQYPRVAEEAFSSETKLMGTLHKTDNGNFVAAKGAVEVLIEKCTAFCKGDTIEKLTEKEKNIFLEKSEEIQAQGTRVLAFAFKEDNSIPTDNFLEDLTFAGFIGFLDPPRMEVVGALQSCRDAGIKVIMITGDHPATALNIAEKIKLSDKENIVINGKELEDNPPENNLFDATVFARVDPKQKLDMVTLYQKRGDIVAMTGDGINDAPALKKADIGIAMGLRGTQVAKETAEIVLKDDSFISIVSAIEQGRAIFQNIKRFLVYLLSCNLSEIFIVFTLGLLNFSFSILPLQILFLNLVTDIFPALALGLGKGNELTMKNPPRNPAEAIVVKKDWINIIVYAFFMALPIMLVSWYCSSYLNYEPAICNNITFFSLALTQLWHVLNLSSRKVSFIKNEVTRNAFVWYALILCIIIMAVFYLVPSLKAIIGLQTLDTTMWLIIVGTSFAPVVLIQLFKRMFKIID
ncbi:cation-translocating P-type ATPase [Algoriphagus antarcticus]|uniref:Ca2+-transporting ATPase n=1 Tax=Algoriphagus antarcticus TaxID=238540 RepID=A0A3E0D761_9BACT|nr:cation-transporting P-type ATPase [Algoriphagus antarcticus]REG78374.1 Ca2+-transporting ATPase [Algoriphagus antarcticus]